MMASKYNIGTSRFLGGLLAEYQGGFEAGFYIHPDWNTFGFFNVPHLHISST